MPTSAAAITAFDVARSRSAIPSGSDACSGFAAGVGVKGGNDAMPAEGSGRSAPPRALFAEQQGLAWEDFLLEDESNRTEEDCQSRDA